MFNQDNFDLDIDDDFSSNILSKGASFESDREVERNKIWEKNVSIESTSNHTADSKTKSSSNFLDFPFVDDSRENSSKKIKRPCSQDDKPQKKRLSDGLLQRKFPGPAGLLPDKPFREISDLELVSDKSPDVENERIKEKEMVFSQNSGSVFLESSYQKLVSDFNLNESDNPLNRYTIEWVKKTALSRGFQRRKIPFLGLVVHSVNQGISDSILVLRDPTGEINGSLHKEVWADMGGKLKAGIALALRQVGVLITGVIRRQIYLNITMNNILSLYGPSENEDQIEITTVNKVSKVELMKNYQDWLALSPAKNIVENPPFNSPLFTTINDKTKNNQSEEIRNLRNKLENLIDKSKEKKSERNTEEVLATLGITLTDNDFKEEMPIPHVDFNQSQVDLFDNEKVPPSSRKTSTQVLSQDESLIFEEVLSGIDLDEFET